MFLYTNWGASHQDFINPLKQRVLHIHEGFLSNMRKSVAIFQTVATKNKEQEAQLHVHHMICTPLK
jgi:hypothetical protein